jgi:thioredoxin-like negative regulator of GroEL
MSNFTSPKSSRRDALKICCVFFALLFVVSTVVAPAKGQSQDPERQKAFELYERGKIDEALPLFEKLEKANPTDIEIVEHLGWLLFMHNDSIKDPVARQANRKRARELLLRAKNAGNDSPVVASMLATVPEDGGDDSRWTFSKKKEVEDAMHAGEAAFMRKDFPKAIEFYQQALTLDPKLYEAALYVGDSYFNAGEQLKAAEWFARAVEIDRDRETAYRYWADSLMKQAKVTEAGDKYIEAFITEPYSRMARTGFVSWASKVGVELAHPKIDFPADVSVKQNGDSTITFDPNALKKDDKSSTAWMLYSLTRTSWAQSEFKKQYPQEIDYRHSLKEETASIRAALKQVDEKSNQIDPSLATLSKLDKEGLLEAYILMARVDEGIAKDFASYRKEHLDKLREYVNKYVMTNGGKN